jgi:ABC-type phosphate/phosphonate transport system, periplasmic component
MSGAVCHASLPMYDWPETRAETLADWATIRDAGRARGLAMPETLGTPDWGRIEAYWRDPVLMFSQTCWGPLSLGLIEHLRPLAQPDYTPFEGGRGPFYRSALIARPETAADLGLTGAVPVPDTPGAALVPGLLAGRRFGVNGRDSLSGYLSLKQDLGADPCDLAADCVTTGGHRGSVIAVAEARADVAAIDCRSWHLALRVEPAAQGLVVVGWTAERPGLPYVTSRATDPAVVATLTEILLELGCHKVAAGRDE